MLITLDSTLVETPNNRIIDLSYKLKNIVNVNGTYNKQEIYCETSFIPLSSMRNSGLIGLLAEAYSSHKSVALYPHDFWMVLISEITSHVKKNKNKFKSLFTDSDEKVEILVPANSPTEIPIDMLASLVSGLVKFDSSILMPSFSTNTPFITEMIQALFCDLSSSYYDYSMFCCGIKSIKLMGTQNDWFMVKTNYEKISELFGNADTTLAQYFTDVNSILTNIYESFAVDNTDFWKNIFTNKNVGSGGDLDISGWITDLFITKHQFNKIQNFCTDYAVVEYKNVSDNKQYKALYGAFDCCWIDGFISLQYSKHIFRLRDIKAEPYVSFETISNQLRKKYYDELPADKFPSHNDFMMEVAYKMKAQFQ